MDRSDYVLVFGILFFASIGGIILSEKLRIPILQYISLVTLVLSFFGFLIAKLFTGLRAIDRLASAGQAIHARMIEKKQKNRR